MMFPRRTLLALSWIFACVTATHATEERPRKIYGHYMGCFAPGTGAIQYHATGGIRTLDVPSAMANELNPRKRHLGAWAINSIGGTYRNFALAPQNRNLTIRQAAELEIKRAMRIGLDGFTFDAWVGGEDAIALLDTMFDICESRKLKFELTITLDSSSINANLPSLRRYPGNKWEKCIRWLLDKHGDSPNLARRDGKVLIMGYQSVWPGYEYIKQHVSQTMAEAPSSERDAVIDRLRCTEEGWRLMAQAYREIEANVGQPIYWEFCMYGFFVGARYPHNTDTLVRAAAFFAREFPAVGTFLWEDSVPKMAKAVADQGAEWCPPMKMQYENYGWMQVASPGLNWVRGDWEMAREQSTTLIQQVTWNDYHENTNLSPGYNTRYAYYDIMGEFIRRWKTGNEPTSDHDKVYIFSHKYANGTPMYPFKAKSRADNLIEVVTILPEPATLRSPGRTTTSGETEWQAPAGMSFKQFPLTPGPVSVELVRDGRVELRLQSPEPVSDRPFRQDTGKVGVCTEDERYWKEDFGRKEPYFSYSEYGDADGDGLPNWFEMLWYGKFGDMRTATVADPDADPANTGETNLQHYLDQTDPLP